MFSTAVSTHNENLVIEFFRFELSLVWIREIPDQKMSIVVFFQSLCPFFVLAWVEADRYSCRKHALEDLYKWKRSARLRS